MRPLAAIVVAVVAACLGTACAKGRTPATVPPEAAGLASIEAGRSELLRAWDARDELREQLAALAEGQPADGATRVRREELEGRLKSAEAAFETAYASDQAALAEFLNQALNARPGAASTLAALRLYADSALRNARDYIAGSGDYRRAGELLETARGYYDAVSATPPADLVDAIAHAREYRCVVRPRFDRLRQGMTPGDIRALLGVPFYANIRHSEVAGKRVTTWLYSRDDGEVAAVYMDQQGRLYAWKWNVKDGA